MILECQKHWEKDQGKQPMKCLGCEGDQMYRYFPHRGEKVRIIHNVQ
jgi:hypothetical protein